MLYAVDSWIIDKLERFSHWTQRCFGLKSQNWELFFIVMSGCCAIAQASPWYSCLPWMFVLFLQVVTLDRPEPGCGLANRLKGPPHQLLRFLLIPAAIVLHATSVIPAWYFDLIVPARYFAACDDLPPGESKVKSFLKSLRAPLRLAPAVPR